MNPTTTDWNSSFSSFRRSESYTSNLPPEDLTVAFGLCVSISIIGTIINTITLLSICRSKKLMSQSTTVFVVSLTVSDLFYCIFCLPLTADTFYECYLCRIEIICRIYAFIFYWNLSVMIMNQTALAFNRYILVRNSPDSKITFNRYTNGGILASVWLLPLLVLLIPLSGLWGGLGFDNGTGTCTIIASHNGSPRIAIIILGLVLPSTFIIYCYTNIYLIVRSSKRHLNSHSHRSFPLRTVSSSGITSSTNAEKEGAKDANGGGGHRSKKEGRLSYTLFMIFICFVIFTAPPAIILAVDPNAKMYPSWHIPLYAFGWLFGLVNPCIYILLNASYRQAFVQFFQDIRGACQGCS